MDASDIEQKILKAQRNAEKRWGLKLYGSSEDTRHGHSPERISGIVEHMNGPYMHRMTALSTYKFDKLKKAFEESLGADVSYTEFAISLIISGYRLDLANGSSALRNVKANAFIHPHPNKKYDRVPHTVWQEGAYYAEGLVCYCVEYEKRIYLEIYDSNNKFIKSEWLDTSERPKQRMDAHGNVALVYTNNRYFREESFDVGNVRHFQWLKVEEFDNV